MAGYNKGVISTGYWTFFYSSKTWDKTNFYNFLNGTKAIESWGMAKCRYREFSAGQLGVIKVVGNGKELANGIYAIVEIIDKFENSGQCKTNIKVICNLYGKPIVKSAIESNPILANDKYLIKGVQGIASMPLREDAFKEICMIAKYPCMPY